MYSSTTKYWRLFKRNWVVFVTVGSIFLYFISRSGLNDEDETSSHQFLHSIPKANANSSMLHNAEEQLINDFDDYVEEKKLEKRQIDQEKKSKEQFDLKVEGFPIGENNMPTQLNQPPFSIKSFDGNAQTDDEARDNYYRQVKYGKDHICHESIPAFAGSFATKEIKHLGKWLSLPSEQFGIAYCPIPKAMSTLGKTLLQMLAKWLDKKGSNPNYNFDDPRGLLINLDDTPESLFDLGGNRTEARVVIIRDPLDRFISTWINICGKNPQECSNDCGTDLHCYIIQLYNHFWRISKLSKEVGTVEVPELGSMDFHFYAQNWWCDLEYKRSVVNQLMYDDNVTTSLFRIFKNAGVADDHIWKLKEVQILRPNPTFDMKEEREKLKISIITNATIFRCFMKLYDADYDVLKIKTV